MPITVDISFTSLEKAQGETLVALAEAKFGLGTRAQALDKAGDGQLKRAAKAAGFKGATKSALDLLAPHGLDCDRILLVGAGDVSALGRNDWVLLGGRIYGELKRRRIAEATVILETKSAPVEPDAAAAVALGAQLRAYRFDEFKSQAPKSGDGDDEAGEDGAKKGPGKLRFAVKEPGKAEKCFAEETHVAAGVGLARDLVNAPANALGPVEFADRLASLAEHGLDVDVLDEKALGKLGMGALLGVAQGSARPARVVVMRWNGSAKKRAKPICFVGKGVVFDTGGISLKPAKGMEDMKGDMAGAAAVAGVMRALAGRKAPVNAVGIVGLVENMPSSKAQRPGDIVRSLAGKTIEVLNTDAEGRLVLADLLWHAEDSFKPQAMINLATLTGAIMVALGKEHAGLFSNDDELAAGLMAAGQATGERLWRMPLDAAYDRELDSKTADMRNIGGPYGGTIIAAQFLKRFVREVPWAHLDVAGTAMASASSDVSESWGSGFGVRLLDQLVRDVYQER
ncbi:MAG: leucyl aminopeptidase [Rhizobiales bacterium]|nr:leucyl aminopeptidase [Hyphomicrobiales bacterium]